MNQVAELLSAELAERCARNSRYSLRALARDLGVAPARLSMILSGKRGISRKFAEDFGQRLGWDKEKILCFCDAADSLFHRSPLLREEARKRFEALYKRSPTKISKNKTALSSVVLKEDQFKWVSDWHHHAILALLYTKGARYQVQWIAKRLGTSPHIVKEAMARLERLQLTLPKKGLNPKTPAWIESTDEVSSQALKLYYENLLKKAQEALFTQKLSDREFGSLVIAVNGKRIPELKSKIKKFLEEIQLFVAEEQERDRVLSLAVQLFHLTEALNAKGERK